METTDYMNSWWFRHLPRRWQDRIMGRHYWKMIDEASKDFDRRHQ